jgi:hypothetical protein
MKRVVQFAIVLVLTGISLAAQQGEVIDRVVALVNSEPILQSDWEIALRCEAMMEGRRAESFTESERQSVFNRLVDQELIREQMKGLSTTPVGEAELDEKLREVRAQMTGASNDKTWQEMLDRSGVTEAELRSRVRVQLETLRYLDEHFRPLARVDFRSVQRYYREQYLPELKKKGAPEVPLAQVSDKIREILVQQRIDEQITIWLQTLRESAEIRIPKGISAEEKLQVTESK